MARRDRLYPSLILHGGSDTVRRDGAAQLAGTLLCERQAAERPCGTCRHCRRIGTDEGATAFHPDLHVLERDQKTVTSIEATRRFLAAAQMAPFEARGQVFVIAAAQTLGPEASDSLLKLLEEPPPRSPRHFLLLSPSSRELSATLRSRSMALFLGAGFGVDDGRRDELAAELGGAVERWIDGGSSLDLLAAAAALEKSGGWADLRAAEPWSLAAAAVVECARRPDLAGPARRALLDLAAALLDAPSHRVRGIVPQRILEGLVVHHLGGLGADPRLAGR
jgi:hypothetical protein